MAKIKTKKVFKNKDKTLEPIFVILVITLIISILSFIFNLIGISGYTTEIGTLETSLITVNSVFSKEGIKYLLTNYLGNFLSLQPLALIIVALISTSILEYSGFLKHIFTNFRKIKPIYVTLMVVFIGVISTMIGDYSYILLLPLAGIFYKYIGRDSILGILTMFISITAGYGTSIFNSYNDYLLSRSTEISAQVVTSNYNYSLNSNLFIMIASTFILTLIITFAIEKYLAKKYKRCDEVDNFKTSKKALTISCLVFFICVILFIYCIIPGLPKSGRLLSSVETEYLAKIFGPNSPLRDGFILVILGILSLTGLIYGKISRNIKTFKDCSEALVSQFKNSGYIFAILFFYSIMVGILNWTNIPLVLSTNLIDFVGSLQFSGTFLIIVVFFVLVLITILLPGDINKWIYIAPVFIPMLMRANISPSFSQFIYSAADSVGKCFSPIYIYLFIAIGFIYKYNKEENIGIFKTMKKMLPVIGFVVATWIVIIVGWYLIGFPVGINTPITL